MNDAAAAATIVKVWDVVDAWAEADPAAPNRDLWRAVQLALGPRPTTGPDARDDAAHTSAETTQGEDEKEDQGNEQAVGQIEVRALQALMADDDHDQVRALLSTLHLEQLVKLQSNVRTFGVLVWEAECVLNADVMHALNRGRDR